MSPPPSLGLHPEHASEQAYIERVHRAEERSREHAARAPNAAADKYAARTARVHMLERLEEPIDPEALCFGRIDLEGGPCHYLGRGAVRDEDNKLLVINWRMPAAEPFYVASARDSRGLARRRRFQLDQLRLLGIVEDIFKRDAHPSSPAAPDKAKSADQPSVHQPSTSAVEHPQAAKEPQPEPAAEPVAPAAEPEMEPHVVDAILAEMDRARGTEMRDIVATIEAQQYELISDSIDGILTIQGGPGSGKTAIALHRAAWLLYNHRDALERAGVLVVGPNRAFMEYVSHVLPTLGETSVVQSAIDRLPDLRDVRVRGTDTIAVARLKGDIRMASVVQKAVHERVRLPETDVEVVAGHTRTTLASDELARLAHEPWRRARTYNAARDAFRRALISLAQERFGESRRRFRSGPSAEEIESAVTASGGPLERIWPTVTAPEVVRDLLNSRQRLAAAAHGALTEEERALLQRDRARLLREEPWTQADISLLDEADAALRGRTSSFGYVLVDEAQDLSPMQLRMVLRRSVSGRATLVGDIAQATGPTRFPDWSGLFDAAAIDAKPRIAELAIGYRVPRQIMEIASQLLPRIAPDTIEPRAVRDGPEEPRLLDVDETNLGETLVAEVGYRVEGQRSVGIIAPASELERLRSLLTDAGIRPGDVLTDGLGRQVTVLSAVQAKGLEFDHVIVVDPAGVAGKGEDWAHVYIALTRATRTLSVLYSTPEPFEIPAPKLEPEDLIERGASLASDLPTVAPAEVGTVLGARYTEALMQAKFLHAGQRRRGTLVPYLAHLQATASMVLEDGGSEDEAIAALLHDSVEDVGPEVLDQIVAQFGLDVARIVAECADPEEEPGVSWRDRKVEHVRALEGAGPRARRVALAEKLDNARALLRDYRRVGDRLWTQMEVDSEDLLWYFATLADFFVTERPGDMASELKDTVERLLDLASAPGPAV